MTALIHPVSGARISSQFGVDRGSHTHGGVDFAASCGVPVVAAASGRVKVARWSDTAGNMIVLDHGGGFDTRYFHLSRFAVGTGDYVKQGDVIGYVGNTGNSRGCHLHFETRTNGKPIDPVRLLQGGVNMAGSSALDLLGGMDDNTLLLMGGAFLLLLVVLATR